jgi:hypothetical protein
MYIYKPAYTKLPSVGLCVFVYTNFFLNHSSVFQQMFVYDYSIKETGNDCMQQEANAATWKDPLLMVYCLCFMLNMCSYLNKHFTAFSMDGHNVVVSKCRTRISGLMPLRWQPCRVKKRHTLFLYLIKNNTLWSLAKDLILNTISSADE